MLYRLSLYDSRRHSRLLCIARNQPPLDFSDTRGQQGHLACLHTFHALSLAHCPPLFLVDIIDWLINDESILSEELIGRTNTHTHTHTFIYSCFTHPHPPTHTEYINQQNKNVYLLNKAAVCLLFFQCTRELMKSSLQEFNLKGTNLSSIVYAVLFPSPPKFGTEQFHKKTGFI